MSEIRFYHLERQSLDQVLPALITKALERQQRVVVKTASEPDGERLSDILWTHDPDSFLPHGTKKDGQAARQPVWITAEDENPNQAEILIVADDSGHIPEQPYSLCCYMIDGRNPVAVDRGRDLWKRCKSRGVLMTYWQQGPNGWEKKDA